jgi:DNA-binding winged helix-turn-helix (wHTH) protein
MAAGNFRFDRFCLDPDNRRLTCDDAPVELNARYLDTLALLVSEQGRLISKDRFFEEVWRGVPVTDEALTQCIRTIRRQLGDDAARPRFIETVPKHGYRFIAPVTRVGSVPAATAEPAASAVTVPTPPVWRRLFLTGGAGMAGGGVAGAFGGLFYGLAGVARPLDSGVGAASVVLVLIALTALVGLAGGAGVSFGVAAAGLAGRGILWSLLGGAGGGLVVGALVKLLGLDAFNLLLGQSPGEITGAGEGALLGGAIGFGAWLGGGGLRAVPARLGVLATAVAGGAAGVLITLLGGRLMGGSLDLLAGRFPGSRISLDPVGALFGESGFGLLSRGVTAGLEGALFCSVVVAAIILARRIAGGERL